MSRTNALLFPQDSIVDDSLFVIREADSLTVSIGDSLARLEPVRYEGVERELVYASSFLSLPILLFVVFNLISLALSSHWLVGSVKRFFFVREKINRAGKISVWIDYVTQYYFFFQSLLLGSFYAVVLYTERDIEWMDQSIYLTGVLLGSMCLLILLWTLLRYLVLTFLDWHMQLKGQMREVQSHIFHSFSLLGVMLFFVSMFVLFNDLDLEVASKYFLILSIICSVSIIFCSMFVFFESRFFILYLILYLCAAEIVPLMFVGYCFGLIETFYSL